MPKSFNFAPSKHSHYNHHKSSEATIMSEKMTMPHLLLMLAEVILIAVLGGVASSHFGLADGARIMAGYGVAYLVPRVILTRTRGTSMASHILFLLLGALLMYVDYSRLLGWTFFDEFSLEAPNIAGDGRAYYRWALNEYNGEETNLRLVYVGFSMLILWLWKILGVSVIWPQSMNLMFTLSAVVLTGMTTRRILAHRVKASPQSLLALGMLLSSLLCYNIIMGTSILKEGPIHISMAMAAFSLSAMVASDEERHHPWRDIILFVVACALMALVRTTYLYFIMLGVLLMVLPHWQRDWRVALGMLAIIGLSLLLGDYFSSYSFDRHAEIVGGGWNMQRFYVTDDSQRFYRDMLNYYFLYPVWHKVLMLPLTMSVQFIIPFPWTYFDTPTFTNLLARMTYGWYFVGGTSLFYFIFVSWRRQGNMGIWPWWAAISFAVVSYIMAGSVARYITPIQPLFVPVAAYVLCRLWEGHWRRAYLGWFIFMVILITVTLLFCLEIQQATISKMLHTQSLVHYLKGIPY